MNDKRKPAVGYIRMSSDQQQDSPARQRQDIQALAERFGYQIFKWYEGHGLTGTESSKRKDFRKRLTDEDISCPSLERSTSRPCHTGPAIVRVFACDPAAKKTASSGIALLHDSLETGKGRAGCGVVTRAIRGVCA